MTQEEILEGNKLIAEFMGYTYRQRPKNNYFGLGERYIELGDISIEMFKVKYHTSWDWLIPVLYKVAGEKSLLVLFNPTDILKTFEGCVKKIKMRNEALKQLNENSTH